MADEDERASHVPASEHEAWRHGRIPYERHESEAARLDRNYSEQLQELRVAQAGVQILFAFLLGIAFQQRFKEISEFQRTVYIVTLISTALAAALFIAPVAIHRVMFHRHLKDELVATTSVLAALGLVSLAMSMLGAVLLITDLVLNPVAAGVITGCLALVFVYLWYLLPVHWRRSTDARAAAAQDDHN
jgi:hypothetical protein